ncbi:MAG: ABC-F family ATP-binding cassette domain-containing protein [Cyclobacteriaceae bacterium]|nr:ABC-F family ATP-binding cassette domain-containing protein [Cyclobacteriaceae bacterium]
MNYLSADKISKSYNDRWLFKNLTLGISAGEKFALVGENGTGKTTLLKILTGEIPSDSGTVSLREGVRLGYLTQQPVAEGHLSIKDILFDESNAVAAAVMRYEECIHNADTSPEEMQTALEQMEELDAWEFDSKVNEITSKLGITNFDQKFSTLSGGQRKRVFMAKMLLQDPNILIMDEPTNHLDLEAIEWLENYLSGQNITLIMVTHDRYFLDNVATTIIELDKGKLYTYKGNYAYFLEKKSEREEILKVEVSKARNLLKKELEWMRRQPKARGTKAKYRIEAFHELKDKASQNLKKERMELDIQKTRQGGKIIELYNVNKSYGEKKMVDDFSYIFKKKDRIGIVGSNGVGKSTFLDLLTGKSKPDSGEILPGQTTKLGYFTQEASELNPDHRVIEEVKDIAEFIALSDGTQISASAFLELFLFPPEKQYNIIGKLSGGEKKRLQLLKVLITNPNFLVLDEPTNDFDIETLNVLEDFLDKFTGCLVLVSHDRYFMDRLVNQLFIFEGDGKIKVMNGNYSDYKSYKEEEEATSAEVKKPVQEKVVAPTDDSKRKISFAEKKEHESLEKEISAMEKEKETLIKKLSSGALETEELVNCSKRIKELTDAIDSKTLRWLELEDFD